MSKTLTLGSLFDGSGGFPLGAVLNGIKPLWASEIEPFPIRVTTKRLQEVKHLGDISAINGGDIEPVDIITFGSPCTNLSVAGRREGLDGEQSSLFFEAVRIIKEMRCATNGRYPRWICWENVPGAYSSNKGRDFLQVLTEITKIKDETYVVPMPEKDRWFTAGEIVGDGFSLAWRTLDAQFWGVAQRRRRCYLVADFAGECAGKVLFEFERLSGYTPQSDRPWQGTAGGTADCVGDTGGCTVLNDQGGSRMDVTDDVTCTLRAEAHHPPCVVESSGFCTEHSAKSRSIGYEKEKSPTLRAGVVPAAVAMFENHSQDTRYTGPVEIAPTVSATYGMGGNNQPFVVSEDNVPLTLKIRSGCEGGGKGALIQEDQSATLSTVNDQSVFVPFRKGTRPHNKDEGQKWEQAETANTLNTFDTGENRCNELAVKAYGICSQASNAMQSDNPHSGIYEADTARTLDAGGGNPTCNQGGIAVCVQGSMIGREEKNGPQGSGVNEETAFTLNTADRHAVAYGIDRAAFNQGRNALYDFAVEEELEPTLVAKGPGAVAEPTYSASKASFFTSAEEELANTLVATDYKDPPLVNDGSRMEYLVRRLTPTECALLQGFPSDWCAELETLEPTDEDIEFWTEVFDTYAKINGKKPKTRNQIIKWLKNPHTDSAEYKMWGNGVALPCVCFVMAGIAYFTQREATETP